MLTVRLPWVLLVDPVFSRGKQELQLIFTDENNGFVSHVSLSLRIKKEKKKRKLRDASPHTQSI